LRAKIRRALDNHTPAIDFRGLKFQNWLSLMAVSVLILTVLWALQFMLLRGFFLRMKLSETRSVGNNITDNFSDVDLDFYLEMNGQAFRNNLRIILIDEFGRVVVGFDGFSADETGVPQPGLGTMIPGAALRQVLQQFEQTNSDRVCFLNTGGRGEVSQAIYVSKIHDAGGRMYYLYVSSAIPTIDSTLSVLKTQFFIITAILFLISLISAQWISQKMSKPIIRLTESAERLAKGELDTDFYGEGFTEIHQLASALNYATGELRSLDNYRREFIANVSHDLKTPLTIIKFYGELIKEVSGDDPQKRSEHCDTIIKEVDWLTGMVGEILELSKLESGNADISKTHIDLSACLGDTLDSFRVLAEKEGYLFETDIEENLTVSGNEPTLRRAVYNLISNAVNYTGDDKRIIITLKSAGNRARFEVTDTGDGIPADQQAAIWDRYYKSDKPHKRAVVGTGIGLSIVKSVFVQHGADYGVISEEGAGSTFWFEMKIEGQNHA